MSGFKKLSLNKKTFGGCSSSQSCGVALIVFIIIFVVICVMVAMFANQQERVIDVPRQIPIHQSSTIMPTTLSSTSITRNQILPRRIPHFYDDMDLQRTKNNKRIRETEDSLIPRQEENQYQEGFITNMSRLYNGLPNPLMPDTKKVIDDFNKNDKSKELIDGMKDKYLGGIKNSDAAKKVANDIMNDMNAIEINKASSSGINDGASRKLKGDKHKGKLNALRASIGPTKPTQPVKGLSTGNPRFNNLSLGSMAIDDRGEGVNLGVSNPIETFGPTIATNSRLAGSSMNITPLTGACFKKYNTDTFFENNTPLPPELNIMEGKPEILKYDVNNTM